jgi:hypothetical protein
MKVCKVEGCDRATEARGWCALHYRRWRRNGDPLNPRINAHVTEHGTYNEYQNYGCRCEPCKAAMAERNREHIKTEKCTNCDAPIWRAKDRSGLCQKCVGLSRRKPLEELHGTELGYKNGCKCARCRKAAADGRRRRRLAMSPEEQERVRQRDRERRRELRIQRMTPLQRATSRITQRTAA